MQGESEGDEYLLSSPPKVDDQKGEKGKLNTKAKGKQLFIFVSLNRWFLTVFFLHLKIILVNLEKT